MSDYDIVIKLDPAQPVQAAAKVTEAVAKIETQSKETQNALDAVTLNAAKAQDTLAQASEKATAKFKQYSAAGAAAWGLLDQKLKMTDTAAGQVVNSAVKFGAIGAQVAGPWGAAIGAIGGALLELGDLIDGPVKQMERLIDAANAPGVYRARQAWLESALAIERVGAQLKALEGLRFGQALAAAAPGMFAVNEYNAELKRQHDLVDQIRGPQREYHAKVDSLNALLKAGKIDQVEFNRGLAMLNETHVEGARVVTQHAQAYKTLADARTEYFRNKYGTPEVFSEQQQNAFLGYDPDAVKRGFQKLAGAASSIPNLAGGGVSSMADLFARSNEEAKKLDETMELIAGQAKNMSVALGDSLVDALNGADVSWRKFGEEMLVSLEKAIAQALILKAITGSVSGAPGASGSYGGILGAIFGGAHATGGSYTAPSTGGGPDSIPVMFRMSPRETATFTPHGQAFGGGAGASPAASPINLNFSPQVYDERALLPVLEGANGQRVIYRMVRQAMGAIRPLG